MRPHAVRVLAGCPLSLGVVSLARDTSTPAIRGGST